MRCMICFNNLSGGRGRENLRRICSDCANDCLNGRWVQVRKNINKMLKCRDKLMELVVKEDAVHAVRETGGAK